MFDEILLSGIDLLEEEDGIPIWELIETAPTLTIGNNLFDLDAQVLTLT